MATVMPSERLEQLAANLAAVRRRVERACRAVDREPAEVCLVAVSKTWPAADVLALSSLGVRDFGESYDGEAAGKAGALAEAGVSVRWHFVGGLQRNKCRSVARYADVVQSVDRPELVDALAGAARRAVRDLDVLVQVSLDGDPLRGGVPVGRLPELARRVVGADRLHLRGIMAVAPLGTSAAPPGSSGFETLREAATALRAEHPGATWVSAGMSGDLEDAVAHGATHVRVGTALFGPRPGRG